MTKLGLNGDCLTRHSGSKFLTASPEIQLNRGLRLTPLGPNLP
jgi:hypothetical protein